MNLHDLQKQILNDLDALRQGSISVSEARARATMARTVVEAEKVELVREQMTAGGVVSAADAKGPRLAVANG